MSSPGGKRTLAFRRSFPTALSWCWCGRPRSHRLGAFGRCRRCRDVVVAEGHPEPPAVEGCDHPAEVRPGDPAPVNDDVGCLVLVAMDASGDAHAGHLPPGQVIVVEVAASGLGPDPLVECSEQDVGVGVVVAEDAEGVSVRVVAVGSLLDRVGADPAGRAPDPEPQPVVAAVRPGDGPGRGRRGQPGPSGRRRDPFIDRCQGTTTRWAWAWQTRSTKLLANSSSISINITGTWLSRAGVVMAAASARTAVTNPGSEW